MLHFTHHANRQYEAELKGILETLFAMGTRVGETMALTRRALTEGINAADETKALDKAVNAGQEEVESRVMALFTRHAPMTDELRFIVSAVKIAASLERIGDMAKNSAKRLSRLTAPLPAGLRESYLTMLDAGARMYTGALALLKEYDAAAAAAICESDDAVDGLYKGVVALAREIGTQGGQGETLPHYLFIAKNLERMADYASDVAREVAYVQTGERLG